MAKTYETIAPDLAEWIAAQPLFFVASAPLDGAGHVNLSPKGLDTLRILGPQRVAYLDLTGSGNETSAHLLENGRITFMFCAFSGAPRILRLFGRGTTALPGSVLWAELAPQFTQLPGARQIIVADIHRVQTSCGFGVPLLEAQSQRDTLIRYAEHHGEETLAKARAEKNARSIDGLITPIGQRN
jgi:hypothetical protein